MIARIVVAVLIAVVVGLTCLLLGKVLLTIDAPITETVGHFLEAWGWAIGVIAGLWNFFGAPR